MKKNHPVFSYFGYFLLFNLCFFALQLALIYSQNNSFISQLNSQQQVYLELLRL